MSLKQCFYPVFCCLFLSTVYGQSTASENVFNFELEAPQLNTIKKIWIYLPESYKTDSQQYPVIYMHDAQNLFDAATSYVGEWKVDEYLDSIKAQVIVVGIEHGNEKRIDELTPYSHPEYHGGKGDAYLSFIVDTVKPYIDGHYRTLADRAHTTIFGSSLGGLISFYAAFKYPQVFGKAGVFSPSFWYSDAIFALVNDAVTLPETLLYFSTGEEEGGTMLEDQDKMVKLLLEKGYPENMIHSSVAKGQQHNEAYWSTEFPNAFQWLFRP